MSLHRNRKDYKIVIGILIYLISFVFVGLSFNLDTENAFIIEGEQKGSEFGYSVALWQDKNNKKWVVVAAPKWQRQVTNLSHTVENTGSEPPLGAILTYDMNGKVGTITNIPVFNEEGTICSYVGSTKTEDFSCARTSPNSFESSFYEGWAVVEGLFDGVKSYYAVSIPGQPTMFGKIIFYTKSLRGVPGFQIFGEDFGGKFGNSLAVGDFDGDSVSDLSVSSHLSSVKSFGSNNEEYILRDAGKNWQAAKDVCSKWSESNLFDFDICPGIKWRWFHGK
ncbi:hypothetical protein Anas_05756 [Armadillidium nasatum]|uniref:Uncharacterized protein n=1 Tax=Armadillidium nasatum TaxID=96803 RepID=A0A5N5SHZ5_9CRUS|nr:hypothetical protein Anas_05756 [Armadillidium nasatum]